MADSTKALFSQSFVEASMGVYVREIRFKEVVMLHKVQIIKNNEPVQLPDGSDFEGKTFPDARTCALTIYAADKTAASSTMPKLRSDSPETFVPLDALMTDLIVVKGQYMRLSVVVYGHLLDPEEVPQVVEHELTGLAAHLRPERPFQIENLDLADCEGSDEMDQDEALDGPDGLGTGEGSAPISFVRSLALGSSAEAERSLADRAAWLHLVHEEREVLDADEVVPKLEALASDILLLARSAPDASAGIVLQGPTVAKDLMLLNDRCMRRFEYRPLQASFRALAAALCIAPTAAEVLRSNGLVQVMSILMPRQDFMFQSSLKLAALQALLQLCSHAVGMEAFLGWSVPLPDAPDTANAQTATAYEIVMALAADGTPGCLRLEHTAMILLKRAAFYKAIAGLDDSCSRLASSDDATGDVGGDVGAVAEALSEVATQFEELSTSCTIEEWLLGDSVPSATDEDAMSGITPNVSSPSAADSEPFASVHPQLHGFLESFLAGRRFVPGLNLLLRRLPKLPAKEKLTVFAPLRQVICAVLACIGGSQFLTADAPALQTFLSLLEGGKGNKKVDSLDLPAVPRFPGALAHSMIGAQQLAALVNMHVRAARLVLTLVARTRQKGSDGILPEADSLKMLCTLHRLCARGAAGRDSVVCAFRSVFLVEWLLKQLEGRLKEAARAASGDTPTAHAVPSPSLRHLVAIVYTLILADPSASVAARFGEKALALCYRGLELLETSAGGGDGDGGAWGGPGCTSLEFSLDSDGPEGGLGKAVRVGRRSADVACLGQLRELAKQLSPWQQVEGEPAPPAAGEPVPIVRLLACLRVGKAPRSFKRTVDDNRVNRLSIQLGGYCGVDGGVEVAEVDFIGGDVGEHGEVPDERFPPSDMAEIPLLAMRLLRRHVARGTREAVEVALTADSAPGAESMPPAGGRGGLAVVVPVLIRCLAALNLNLEALTVQEDKTSIDEIYATQQVHAQLLEAGLQTCFHLLRGLEAADLSQYRHTDLLHALLLLADRLTSNIVGTAPTTPGGSDPEFRLLWRQCLVWVCNVFRTWVQSFPSGAAGQLLQPLLRHARVLSWHFTPGLLLLGTCGSLRSMLPPMPCTFKLADGPCRAGGEVAGEQSIQSHSLLLAASTRGGSLGHVVATVKAGAAHPPAADHRAKVWGQLWGTDVEKDEDWDMAENGMRSAAFEAVRRRDPLVRTLSKKAETGTIAAALALVGHVNSRCERLSMDDLGELAALVAQSAVTSDAFLHLTTVHVLERLTAAGLPVIGLVLKIGEAALGADTMPDIDADAQVPSSSPAVRDPRDARAVSRVLMLLTHFGQRGGAARSALVEHRAETLCLSVLATHGPSALPSTAATQAIRVLGLMFCHNVGSAQPPAETSSDAAASSLSRPSVTKCRMVTKALTRLLNRPTDEGASVGPTAMGAAFELLLRLSREPSMCLNLLFSVTEESVAENTPSDHPITVSLSCAFRLSQCAARLAQQLTSAGEHWEASAPGTEGESEAEEVLESWLHVGELLIILCQTILVNCPTVNVFLAVMSPSGMPPENVDESALQAVLGDVGQALGKLCQTRSVRDSTAVPMQAATLVGKLRALKMEVQEFNPGAPPTTLRCEEICPPWLISAASGEASAEPASSWPGHVSASEPRDGEVLMEVVGLFSALGDLEADPEWKAVSELDAADSPADGSGAWEFDAVAHRKKRQAQLEKAESDRKAKRLKQSQSQNKTTNDRDGRDDRFRRDAPRSDKDKKFVWTKDSERDRPTTAELAVIPEPKAAPPAPKEAKPEADAGEADAGKELARFVKDHPHFMRVLQNPKKCLNDPRVKTMFVTEVVKYPIVKAFLEKKGLNLS